MLDVKIMRGDGSEYDDQSSYLNGGSEYSDMESSNVVKITSN